MWSRSLLPLENIQIQATALPFWWREHPEARLNVLLKKVRDFRYQSIMYVTTPSILPPLL